jgi:hypothetical protein
MRKLSYYSLITIIAALAIYGYYYKPDWLGFIPWFKAAPLTQEELAANKKICDAKFAEARRITDTLRAGGEKVTDPRVFFSETAHACLATYLVQDPELPNNQTYNSYVIYNLDKGKELYSKAKNMLKTYTDYLNKMNELDK